MLSKNNFHSNIWKKIKVFIAALMTVTILHAENTDLKFFMGKWENTIDKGSYTNLTISPVEGSSSSAMVKFHYVSSGQLPVKSSFQKKGYVILDNDNNPYLLVKYEKQGHKFEIRIARKNESSSQLRLGKLVSLPSGETEKEYLYFNKKNLIHAHVIPINPTIPQRTNGNAPKKKCEIKGVVSGTKSAKKSAVVVVERKATGEVFFGDINTETGRYKISDLEPGKYKLMVLGNGGNLKGIPSPAEKTITLKQNSTERIKVQNINIQSPKPAPGSVCISYKAYDHTYVNQYILILVNNNKEYVAQPSNKTFVFEGVSPGTYTLYSDCKSCLTNLNGYGRKITVKSGETVLLDLSTK